MGWGGRGQCPLVRAVALRLPEDNVRRFQGGAGAGFVGCRLMPVLSEAEGSEVEGLR